MLKLRPHHLMCMFFYRGFGYNKEFIDNMNKIQELLIEASNKEITLVKTCDVICEKCPNKKAKGYCNTEDSILKLDNNMIKEFNLVENKRYRFKEIVGLVLLEIKEENFIRVCKDCMWFKTGICSVDKILEQRVKWS